jgi:ABC-type methionine transport system permease subunit
MLTVFAFLVILVAAMSALRRFAAGWAGTSSGADAAVVAAAVAAIHHRESARSNDRSEGRS